MLAFTRSLSRELGAHNIAVNTLSPGSSCPTPAWRSTHVRKSYPGAQQPRLQARRLSGGLSATLIYLCSSDSDFVTGQSLVVDGGSVNN